MQARVRIGYIRQLWNMSSKTIAIKLLITYKYKCTSSISLSCLVEFNPLKPTVAMWVQL